MKKIISLIIVICILSQFSFAVASAEDINDDININYVQAEMFLRSLGIIDGEIDYNDNLTRGQAAMYLTKVLNEYELVTSYRGIFKDVDETHKYALYIESIMDKGIIKGAGDYTFRPDDMLTYDHIMIMLVNMLGYAGAGDTTKTYYSWAHELNLYKNLTQEFDYVNMGDFLVVIENALHAELMSKTVFGDKDVYVVTDSTLLATIYKTVYNDGVIVKNDITYLWSAQGERKDTIVLQLQNSNRIEIKVDDPEKTTYDLGKKVRVYYRFDSDEYEYVYHRVSRKNKIFKTDLCYIEDSETDLLQGVLAYSDGSINTKKVNISNNFYIIYNGVTYRDLNIDFGNLVKLSGYVELIDNNADNKYDVVNIKAYETVIANEIILNHYKITDKYDNAKSVDLNPDNYTRVIIFDKEGNNSSLEKIVSGNVISVAKSDAYNSENNCIEIWISDNVKTGKITHYNNEDKDLELELDYMYNYGITDRALNTSIVINTFIMAYIDVFENVVYLKSDYGRNMQYGLVLKTGYIKKGITESVILKMLTMDGQTIAMKLAENVKLDGKFYRNKPLEVYQELATMKIKSSNFNINEEIYVINFKTNSSDEINVIDTHISSDDESLTDDNLSFIHSGTILCTSGNVLGWTIPYSADTLVLEITSPNFNNKEMYTYNYRTGANGFSAGTSYNVALFKGNPESIYADFVIKLSGGVGLSTASFVVEKVTQVYNEDEGCAMHKIRGYLQGVYKELWIDEKNDKTSGMTSLQCGDIIRLASNVNDFVIAYDKIVTRDLSGTTFRQVSSEGYDKTATKTLTNIFGYVYEKDGYMLRVNKFPFGTIPTSASSVNWDNVDKLYVGITTSLPIVVIDMAREKVEIGNVNDILDYITFGDKATKIFARYRNSVMQEFYVYK